jgi:hypothetical protein
MTNKSDDAIPFPSGAQEPSAEKPDSAGGPGSETPGMSGSLAPPDAKTIWNEPIPDPPDEAEPIEPSSAREKAWDGTVPGLFEDLDLTKEIGKGGMGVVYEARYTILGSTVAVKMINLDSVIEEDPFAREAVLRKARDRFEHEAKVLAKLKHEHIVTIHRYGVHAGHPYFVLEHAEGGNLLTGMDKSVGARPDVAARLIRDLAKAMHFAHQRGIIHRDINK